MSKNQSNIDSKNEIHSKINMPVQSGIQQSKDRNPPKRNELSFERRPMSEGLANRSISYYQSHSRLNGNEHLNLRGSHESMHGHSMKRNPAPLEIVGCIHEEEECDWTGCYSYLPNHLKECDYEIVPCQNYSSGCKEKLRRKDMQTHLNHCDYTKIICKKCNQSYLRKDLFQHNKNCFDKQKLNQNQFDFDKNSNENSKANSHSLSDSNRSLNSPPKYNEVPSDFDYKPQKENKNLFEVPRNRNKRDSDLETKINTLINQKIFTINDKLNELEEKLKQQEKENNTNGIKYLDIKQQFNTLKSDLSNAIEGILKQLEELKSKNPNVNSSFDQSFNALKERQEKEIQSLQNKLNSQSKKIEELQNKLKDYDILKRKLNELEEKYKDMTNKISNLNISKEIFLKTSNKEVDNQKEKTNEKIFEGNNFKENDFNSSLLVFNQFINNKSNKEKEENVLNHKEKENRKEDDFNYNLRGTYELTNEKNQSSNIKKINDSKDNIPIETDTKLKEYNLLGNKRKEPKEVNKTHQKNISLNKSNQLSVSQIEQRNSLNNQIYSNFGDLKKENISVDGNRIMTQKDLRRYKLIFLNKEISKKRNTTFIFKIEAFNNWMGIGLYDIKALKENEIQCFDKDHLVRIPGCFIVTSNGYLLNYKERKNIPSCLRKSLHFAKESTVKFQYDPENMILKIFVSNINRVYEMKKVSPIKDSKLSICVVLLHQGTSVKLNGFYYE